MRRTDLDRLNQLYTTEGGTGDRFAAAIGADVPHARRLTKEILSDLSETTFGLPTLSGLPDQERILVSDYLYQCASSIEENLVEAKIHFMEWQDAADKINDWFANVISMESGEPEAKMPPVTKPAQDLPFTQEKLHICGFFRAVGSAIDCLGGAMVGILGLPIGLRRADFSTAQKALDKLTQDGTDGRKVQIAFRDFVNDTIQSLGPLDWLVWSTQYRNMFVHRGRRLFVGHFEPKEAQLFDGRGRPFSRAQVRGHLAKYPDKSDVEAFLLGGATVLNEDIETTLTGLFKSVRDFLEANCEEILRVWIMRKQDPSLLVQPSQWKGKSKPCVFDGYDSTAEPLSIDALISHATAVRRLRAASSMDSQRQLWNGSDWLVP